MLRDQAETRVMVCFAVDQSRASTRSEGLSWAAGETKI